MNNTDLQKEFFSALKGLDRSYNEVEHFRNFCEMAFCAMAKTTHTSPDKRDALEARYMDVVASYPNKDDIRTMPELMATTIRALSRGGCDFLGDIAAEIGALDKKNGQFFTPYNVAELMASLEIESSIQHIKEKGFYSLSDPAAGAGCMILAAADTIEKRGYAYQDCMSAHVVELNATTYKMLYVQLAFKGIAAQVVHGNSLTLETYDAQYTPAMFPFFAKHGTTFGKQEPRKAHIVEQDTTPNILMPIQNGTQLSLF